MGIRNRGVLVAGSNRPDRLCDLRQRPHGPADHEHRGKNRNQNAGRAENDALPFGLGQRPREVVRQHPPLLGAAGAQQFGHPPDLPAFGAQHILVELGDLAFRPGDGDNGIDVAVGRFTHRRIVDRQCPHALRPIATAAIGSCANNADVIWFCARNSVLARLRSGTWPIAVSNFARAGGSAASSPARREIRLETRSMPLL